MGVPRSRRTKTGEGRKGTERQKEGGRTRYRGSAFEAEKFQAGRGKEREGENKAGGQATGGIAFEAEETQAGRGNDQKGRGEEGEG